MMHKRVSRTTVASEGGAVFLFLEEEELSAVLVGVVNGVWVT